MLTKSIRTNYCKNLISWGLINFWGPIEASRLTSKKTVPSIKNQPIRISDINIIKGFN